MKRCLALVSAVLVLATYCFAQNATGTIDGRVVDASDAAVPGATVIIENSATNVKLTTRTNGEGRFLQRYLLPATYTLTVEKTGFQKYIQSGILLDVEQTDHHTGSDESWRRRHLDRSHAPTRRSSPPRPRRLPLR